MYEIVCCLNIFPRNPKKMYFGKIIRPVMYAGIPSIVGNDYKKEKQIMLYFKKCCYF